VGQGIRISISSKFLDKRRPNLFRFFVDGIEKYYMGSVAKDFKILINRNIEQNTFKFQLNPNWVNYKERLGADTRPFIMYGHYRRAIVITKKGRKIQIGFKSGMIHPRARVPIAELAKQLEYGDAGKGIPARPLWRLTADQYKIQMKKNFRKRMLVALKDGNNVLNQIT
jgi:hypothetical protein